MQLSAFQRINMQKGQLETCAIRRQAVLSALQAVARERYVPDEFAATAYVDEEIPLGHGRYLMEPLVFARMLEMADIQPNEKVMDVGCGLGYSSAVLSHLAHHVVAVETRPELVSEARKRLNDYNNVEVVTAPLATGCPRQQPYDVILLEGAVHHVPRHLLSALTLSGRLVTVHNRTIRPGSQSGLGNIVMTTRRGEVYTETAGADVSVALLPGFEEREAFSFPGLKPIH